MILARRCTARLAACGGTLLLASQAAPQSAHALTLTTIDVYAETLTAIGFGVEGGGDADGVFETGTPFPSSLGTLEDVRLTFSGSLELDILPGSNLLVSGPGGVIPTAYTIAPELFISINGLFNMYDMPALGASTSIAVDGSGNAITRTGNYSFTFTYSDLLNQFIGPSNVSSSFFSLQPPAVLGGSLEDFLASPIFPPELLIAYEFGFTELGRINSGPTHITATSVLQVFTNYIYSEPVEVPEPNTRHLLLLGLLLLAFVHPVLRSGNWPSKS